MIARGLLLLVELTAAVTVGAQVDLVRENPQTFDDCDRLVREHPKEYEACRCYGALALRKDQRGEAAARLHKLLAADPDNPRVLCYLSIFEGEAGNRELAESLMHRAREAFIVEGDRRGEAGRGFGSPMV